MGSLRLQKLESTTKVSRKVVCQHVVRYSVFQRLIKVARVSRWRLHESQREPCFALHEESAIAIVCVVEWSTSVRALLLTSVKARAWYHGTAAAWEGTSRAGAVAEIAQHGGEDGPSCALARPCSLLVEGALTHHHRLRNNNAYALSGLTHSRGHKLRHLQKHHLRPSPQVQPHQRYVGVTSGHMCTVCSAFPCVSQASAHRDRHVGYHRECVVIYSQRCNTSAHCLPPPHSAALLATLVCCLRMAGGRSAGPAP